MQSDEGKTRKLVKNILESYRANDSCLKIDGKKQVSRTVVVEIIDRLRALVFAGFFGRIHLKKETLEYFVGDLLEALIYDLKKQIGRAMVYSGEPEERSEEITYAFLDKLPKIRELMSSDVEAFFDGDPAAMNREEIILSYPGIYAIMVARLAHELYLLGVPMIPRIMTEHAHSLTGVDIHPGAEIGHHFFIDHGTGIVIGETTVIGNFVKIYQGVTLGALSTKGGQSLKSSKRHPTIEDHATIYSGSSIFGGGTVIGEGAVIGSNAFIVKSVLPHTKVSIKNQEMQSASAATVVDFTQDEFWYYTI